MSFISKLAKFSVNRDFTGFASTINTEFEITIFNALFNLLESLINAQFAKALCFLIDVLTFL